MRVSQFCIDLKLREISVQFLEPYKETSCGLMDLSTVVTSAICCPTLLVKPHVWRAIRLPTSQARHVKKHFNLKPIKTFQRRSQQLKEGFARTRRKIAADHLQRLRSRQSCPIRKLLVASFPRWLVSDSLFIHIDCCRRHRRCRSCCIIGATCLVVASSALHVLLLHHRRYRSCCCVIGAARLVVASSALQVLLLHRRRYRSCCCIIGATGLVVASSALQVLLLRHRRYRSCCCVIGATGLVVASSALQVLLLRHRRYRSCCCAGDELGLFQQRRELHRRRSTLRRGIDPRPVHRSHHRGDKENEDRRSARRQHRPRAAEPQVSSSPCGSLSVVCCHGRGRDFFQGGKGKFYQLRNLREKHSSPMFVVDFFVGFNSRLGIRISLCRKLCHRKNEIRANRGDENKATRLTPAHTPMTTECWAAGRYICLHLAFRCLHSRAPAYLRYQRLRSVSDDSF